MRLLDDTSLPARPLEARYESSSMTITIYDGQVSANARKVRLFAAELGLPLHRVTLNFQKGELRAPDHIARNPNGKIPTIDDDGFVLWESAAILKYFAAKHPERGFAPKDPREQAEIDRWLFWLTAHVEPWLYVLVVERRVKPFLGQAGNDPSLVRESEAALARFLPIFEAQLDGKEHVLGKLSLVDFAAAPWLEVTPALGVDLAPYPQIKAWLARMQARPYWKEA
jgi:glutathione S-transferase